MKIRILCFSLFAAQVTLHAAIVTGSFDFFGASYYGFGPTDQLSGTSIFSYDTTTNLGIIHDFYRLGGSTQDVRFMVWPTDFGGISPIMDESNALLYAGITGYADLVNFGIRSAERLGIGGSHTGQYYNYSNKWVFLSSQIHRGENFSGATWSYSSSTLFNPPTASGTASNFQPTPEPLSGVMIAIGTIALAARRRRAL